MAGLLDLDVHVLLAPDADGQTLVFYEPRDAASRANRSHLALLDRRIRIARHARSA